MFLKVVDARYGDEVIINTEKISCIYPGPHTIIMNGVHGEGNGILHLDENDMKKVVSKIDIK